MVKKLLKQEFKYYIHTLIFILPVVLFLGISTYILHLFETDSIIYQLLYILSMVLFSISTFAALLAVEILMVVRFYKNMYTSEGYLTFTLPVNSHQHVFAKLIAHIICLIATVFVVVISWLIVVNGMTDLSEEFNFIWSTISNAYTGENAVHAIFITLELIVLFAIAVFTSPLIYYSCISIGQLAKKNRIILAIVTYYLYTVIAQVLLTVFTMILSILATKGLLNDIPQFIIDNPFATIHIVLIVIILITIGISALFYFITIRIMNNKLNLE